MVDRVGRRESGRWLMPRIALAGLFAGFLSACAGTDIPPLRPDLPDDLRQPQGSEPDFRQPPPRPEAPPKSAEEQADTVNELETLRDTHENNARRAIEGG